MPTQALFDFKDASWKGDPKWAKTSPRFAAYAPPVVAVLGILSIIEVVLGIVWITGISSLSGGWGDLSFAAVVQPLIVPACAFFNTIPSLHLHVLARSNNPLMAIIFSSLLSAAFLASAIVFLVPCAGGNATYISSSNSFQRTECPLGSKRGVWAGMIALQLLSAILYAVHAAQAGVVHGRLRRWLKDGTLETGADEEGSAARRGFTVGSGGGGRRMVMVVLTEEEKKKREEEARRRWQEIVDL